MNAGTITALATAVAGVIGAVTALVAQVRHATGPAHNPPAGQPPVTPGQ